jgi:hypothetical protein
MEILDAMNINTPKNAKIQTKKIQNGHIGSVGR